jgi:ubiquinone/menaquinone biosynthesis C-methylase UbiE
MSDGCSAKRAAAAKKFLRRSLRLLKPDKNHIILEVGCGTGEVSRWLAGKGYKVHGIDFIPQVIEYAEGRLKGASSDVQFHVCDAVHMNDFNKNTFHCIIDGHCLHYIISIKDRSRYFANASRVLKRGGLFLIMTRCHPHREDVSCNYQYSVSERRKYASHPRYVVSAEKISAEVEAAGFKIIEKMISTFDRGKQADFFIHACKE